MSRNATARSIIVPPPVQGWNTRDPISQMDPLYAVEATNFFSLGNTVDLRKGYTVFATGRATFSFQSIFELSRQNGTRHLIGIDSGNRAYNITAGGAGVDLSNAGAFPIRSIATATNFRNRIFFKGIDDTANPVYLWDGITATLTAAGFVGPGGFDLALENPEVYRSRLYFIGSNSASIWYGGVDAITSPPDLIQFDVQSVLSLGGRLRFAGGMAKQGDTNANYFVMISDQGEVLLYSGDYPGSATWQLVGTFFMPPPISPRSFIRYGANLAIMTWEGIVLLSDVISSVGQKLTFLSEKINPTFKETLLGASSANQLLCSGVYYPRGSCLLFNIYDNTLSDFTPFVYSTANGSWWKWQFTDLLPLHWTLFSNELYSCSSGNSTAIASKHDNGYFDENPASIGTARNRTVVCRPAYNYFGDPSSVKRIGMVQPYIYQSEGLSLTIGADMDFADTTPTTTVTDATDTAYKLYTPVIPMVGVGSACSMRIEQTVTTKRMSLQAMKITYESGGAY